MRRVLFVCLGNICRSPAAEGVFEKMVKDAGLENAIEIDSAGTIATHAGEGADPRMQKHALKRGYQLSSISRKFLGEQDFNSFDYIIVMDDSNFADVSKQDLKDIYANKVHKLTDYSQKLEFNEVPDPYFGGEAGFETVMDIVEDSCLGLLEKIKTELLNK